MEPTKPAYYRIAINGNEFDIIDLIHAMNLNFCLGNVLKYIYRVKGDNAKRINDLEKAKEYIDREIKRIVNE